MATLKEIAEMLNISTSTVSRVLSGDETISVSEETRNGIIATAKSLNYISPSRRAKDKESSAKRIGIAQMFEGEQLMEDTYYLIMKSMVEELVFSSGNELVLMFRNDRGEFKPSTDAPLDGIIAIGRFTAMEINCFENFTKNIVFIDSCPDEAKFSGVVPNYSLGVRLALDCLIENGHKDIGFLGSIKTFGKKKDLELDGRYTAFLQYLGESSILNDELIYNCDMNSRSSYEVMLDVFNRGKLPTALFVSSDATACGLIRALTEKRMTAPEHISIIAFNNTTISENLELTSVGANIKANAKAAVNLMDELLNNTFMVPQKVVVSCYLEHRKSVSKI